MGCSGRRGGGGTRVQPVLHERDRAAAGKYLDTLYSLTEARLLFELAQRDASEVPDLRRTVDIDPGYLSRILARFASDGLIARQRSARTRAARSSG